MEPFEPKPDFEYPIQKPSFDSVVRQKRREAEQKAEQERYKVANLQVPEEPDNEPLYTEMEQKMMDEARELSRVGHLSDSALENPCPMSDGEDSRQSWRNSV